MDTNREIRKKAWVHLREYIGGSVLISLVAFLLGGVNALSFMLEVPTLLLLQNTEQEMYLALALTVHIAAGLFIGGMIELGHDRCYLRIRTGEKPSVGELFSLKPIWFKGLTLRLLLSGEIALRTLLLIVPGVIALFQYALAPFLMAQNPSLDTPEAVKMSSGLMKGYKTKLFKFVLGYTPWFILSILTFGLGFLLLTPYYKIGLAEFYAERVREHDRDVRIARNRDAQREKTSNKSESN